MPIRRIQSQLETLADPVLEADELGLDPATRELRVGDGSTAWSALSAAGSGTYVRLNGTSPVLSPLVGVIGDSLSVNTDTAARPCNSPLFTASLKSAGKIRYTYMGGVSGENSTQILARVGDFVATGAKTIIVGPIGTNDSGGTQFDTVTKANLDALITGILARGGTPVLCTRPPRGTSGSPATTAQKTDIAKYNLYIRNYWAPRLGTPVIDFYSALVDPSNDYYAAGVANDGIHPNASGYAGMGSLIDSTLSPLMMPSSAPLPLVNPDPTNLLAHGLMLGGNTGGIATGWTLAAGATGVTPTVTSSAIGNKQLLTASASSGAYALWQQNITVTPGSRLLLVGLIDGAGLLPTLQLDSTTVGGSTSFAVMCAAYRPPVAITTPTPVMARYTVPADVNRVNVEFVIQAGTGTASLAQAGLYDLTALGIA